MRRLTGEWLLEAWEGGAHQSDADRALTMLAVACPQTSPEQLATIGIPELYLQLLQLRQLSFGADLAGSLPCSSCGTRLEFTVPIAPLVDRLRELLPDGPRTWTIGPRTYRMRPVNSQDLTAAIGQPDARSARRMLLDRCLSVTDAEGFEDRWDHGDPVLEEAALRHFEQMHQGAEISFTVHCPACAAIERVDLDIGRFLWSELRHAAIRLVHEVHDLACAYGWSEATIMAMSSQRRSMYLNMVRA
jgi:hypothetical protein